jgi:hypothetical protein
MSNLWQLRFGGTAAVPILTRGDSVITDNTTDMKSLLNFGIYGDQTNQVQDPINVVDDFAWTVSPKSSRYDVPRIQMIEHRIIFNSTITNLVYSTTAAADAAGTVGVTAGVTAAGNVIDRFFPPAAPPRKGAPSEEEISRRSRISKLRDGYERVLESAFLRTFESTALKPYNALYATEQTGFNYFFPYLDDSYRQSTNAFGEGGDNIIAPYADIITAGLGGVASGIGLLKPGVYIEKSKQFTMGAAGRTISFSFPLLNTNTFDDVLQNWQLIFGIVYQNRPGRVSKSIIDVPVIYELYIPGIAYMPYAYIKNLEVKFLGNRRVMEIDVPIMNEGEGNTSRVSPIKTIIPDAYNISIQVEGLNDETRNFMYASVNKDNLTINPDPGPDIIIEGDTPVTDRNNKQLSRSWRQRPARAPGELNKKGRNKS